MKTLRKELRRRARQVVSVSRRLLPGRPPVWSGVYRHYRDVPARGPGFAGDLWSDETGAATRRALAELRSGGLTGSLRGDRSLLPLLVSALTSGGRHIHVLDFGGGMGISYVHLRNALQKHLNVDYSIIETERLCVEGRSLLGTDASVRFFPTVPETLDAIDVLHIHSALQYVEDYTGLLHKLLRHRPRYALFVNLSAGDVQTYATAQTNVQGSVLPYWIIGLDELIAIMHAEGYELLMRSASEARFQGLAVPGPFRIERGCNLLFGRTPN